jgi:hypothetical protein
MRLNDHAERRWLNADEAAAPPLLRRFGRKEERVRGSAAELFPASTNLQ